MVTRIVFFFLVLIVAVFASFSKVQAQDDIRERHTMVAIRMIGHRILLLSGDSTSRVLPVEKEGDRYKLQFESAFQFEPDQMVGMIDSLVKQTGIAESYLVEVRECSSGNVVYSYEIGLSSKSDVVPCDLRVQPKSCYTVLFTILTPGSGLMAVQTRDAGMVGWLADQPQKKNFTTILFILGLVALAVLFFRQKKKDLTHATNPEIIPIGASLFDKRNMQLIVHNETVELSGKEADLLCLLHSSANTTLERDVILNAVWGDEGDYAGRTLDVFISKLRKKLESDETLRIVNIRGVGYKLIVNG